jgi:predicted site-specific integrase-resolvase
MKYTLSEAAAATGKNKATIQRAIKSGKISAPKGESGSYEIDPSELHRVFQPVAQRVAQRDNATTRNIAQQAEFPPDFNVLQRIADLEKDLAVMEERKNGLEEQKSHLTNTVEDLRKRLDSSDGRVLALLNDQRPRGFWKRLLGRQ